MKRRWNEESEIIAAIDHNHEAGIAKLKEAEECEQEIEENKRFIAANEDAKDKVTRMKVDIAYSKIEPLRRQVLKARKRATTLLEVKAKKLQNQLAIFRTRTMEFCPDQSIPA
jgi:hypothetical protein